MQVGLKSSLRQQTKITPQLQQAIGLLQLSSIELEHVIQEIILSNPMLELESESPINNQATTQTTLVMEQFGTLISQSKTTPSPIHSQWDNFYPHKPGNNTQQDRTKQYKYYPEAIITLQDHLRSQAYLAHFSESDYLIAITIIDAINENGFLSCPLEDIQNTLATKQSPININDIITTLRHIQHFDPIGSGSRNPQECLLVQLRALPNNTPYRQYAETIIQDQIELLAQHNYRQLRDNNKLSQHQLQQTLTLIKSLSPYPGRKISSKQTEYIIPDILVKRHNNHWVIELNPYNTPALRINPNYVKLIDKIHDQVESNFLRSNLHQARYLMKNIKNRQETLRKVSVCIMQQQQDFLKHGEEAIKPLLQQEVAEIIGMHGSTISRITTAKYIDTPYGIYALKDFFSISVSSDQKTQYASKSIQATIRKVIATENPLSPLTDHEIGEILQKQGIKIMRRTITKYRKSIGIPSSYKRKSYV